MDGKSQPDRSGGSRILPEPTRTQRSSPGQDAGEEIPSSNVFVFGSPALVVGHIDSIKIETRVTVPIRFDAINRNPRALICAQVRRY